MIIVPQGRAAEIAVELARQAIGSTGFVLPQPMVVMRNGQTAAIAIFHDYRLPDIQVSLYAATPRWAHPSTVRDLLSYPFLQLGCQRITAVAKRGNKRSRKLIEGLGWKLEGVMRKASRDGSDFMIYGMLFDEYEARYGRTKSTFTNTVPGRPGPATGPGQVRSATKSRVETGPATASAAARSGSRKSPGFGTGTTPAGCGNSNQARAAAA